MVGPPLAAHQVSRLRPERVNCGRR